MTKPKKKITKKYEMSRAVIVDELEAIANRLGELDVLNTSPSDVETEIADIRDALDNLTSGVGDEQY